MTSSPAAPPSTPAGVPFLFGPVAVVYGRGLDSERAAGLVHDEYTRRGFHGESLPTEETTARLNLSQFPAAVLVTPSEGLEGDLTEVLRPSAVFAGVYRRRWPGDIAALRANQIKSYEAGCLQVIGYRSVLESPAAAALLDKACAWHDMQTPSLDPDAFFRVYHDGQPVGAAARSILPGNFEMSQLWDRLRGWGLRNLADVDEVLRGIEQRRDHYLHEARWGLQVPPHGPVRDDGSRPTRYDCLLDGPHKIDHPSAQVNTNWMSDGAEVLREVSAHLKRNVLPTFQPWTKRDAQRRFHHFYLELKLIRRYVRETPAEQQIFFSDE